MTHGWARSLSFFSEINYQVPLYESSTLVGALFFSDISISTSKLLHLLKLLVVSSRSFLSQVSNVNSSLSLSLKLIKSFFVNRTSMKLSDWVISPEFNNSKASVKFLVTTLPSFLPTIATIEISNLTFSWSLSRSYIVTGTPSWTLSEIFLTCQTELIPTPSSTRPSAWRMKIFYIVIVK